MINRPMSLTQPGRSGQRPRDEVYGRLRGLEERPTGGQLCCQRCGQRAARAVPCCCVQTGPGPDVFSILGQKKIDRFVPLEVPALHQGRSSAQVEEGPGGHGQIVP